MNKYDMKDLIIKTETLERESLNNQPEDNSHKIKLIPSDDEDKGPFVDALEQQLQQIRVIGPRHPKLISSNINSKNILQFCRRQPRTNLIKQECSIPNSFEEERKSSNKDKWCLAIQKEILNINRLNVWTLRNETIKNNQISSMWIFKIKQDDSGKVTEYKARLCSHGFHQIEGLDYQKTFAPIGRLLSLQTLISFATINNYKFHKMDVRSTFLNAPLQQEICLEKPQGIEEDKKNQDLLLNKELYGLKQDSLSW
ncbi:hypothetical protein O181_098216 [Austropuccinia psidii MF-1]|uniref:Reverse transcriptase Ty1/copia-type domain-containing protein n=1 Tax=Austropuccinia psidii MF-1 TaxID=1389203 RepID=A0A9Q3PFS0_9BASI|nr:hypothetical protein [Austropuccinia psidii MF-1]